MVSGLLRLTSRGAGRGASAGSCERLGGAPAWAFRSDADRRAGVVRSASRKECALGRCLRLWASVDAWAADPCRLVFPMWDTRRSRTPAGGAGRFERQRDVENDPDPRAKDPGRLEHNNCAQGDPDLRGAGASRLVRNCSPRNDPIPPGRRRRTVQRPNPPRHTLLDAERTTLARRSAPARNAQADAPPKRSQLPALAPRPAPHEASLGSSLTIPPWRTRRATVQAIAARPEPTPPKDRPAPAAPQRGRYSAEAAGAAGATEASAAASSSTPT
jgi:hypothetical protein